MNIFEFNRFFWNFAFDNPEKIKPNHCAVYYFALEHCNRLGWKKKFGFPTSMVLDATGIKSYSVFKRTFDDLVLFGFFEVIEYSKNQYSSNVIALKENYKAPTKALDKALTKHLSKQCQSTVQSTVQSTDSIDIQYTIDNNTINNNTIADKALPFSFFNSLIDYGFDQDLCSDWLKVRKTKKATNTKIAFDKFIAEVEKNSLDKNEILKICIEKSWSGFESQWIDGLNINLNKKITNEQFTSITAELRRKNPNI